MDNSQGLYTGLSSTNFLTTNAYQRIASGYFNNMLAINDGTNAFTFSLDGVNDCMIVNSGEAIPFWGINCGNQSITIFVKSNVANNPTVGRLASW